MNDVTFFVGGIQGFCDDNSQDLVIKRVKMGRGSKIVWHHLWTTPWEKDWIFCEEIPLQKCIAYTWITDKGTTDQNGLCMLEKFAIIVWYVTDLTECNRMLIIWILIKRWKRLINNRKKSIFISNLHPQNGALKDPKKIARKPFPMLLFGINRYNALKQSSTSSFEMPKTWKSLKTKIFSWNWNCIDDHA